MTHHTSHSSTAKSGALLKVGLGVAAVGAVIFFATRSSAAEPVSPAPAPTPNPNPQPAPVPVTPQPTPAQIQAAQQAGQAGGAADALNAALNTTAGVSTGRAVRSFGAVMPPNVTPVRVCRHPHGCNARVSPWRNAASTFRVPAGARVRVLQALPGGRTDKASPGMGGWVRIATNDAQGRPMQGYALQEWFT